MEPVQEFARILASADRRLYYIHGDQADLHAPELIDSLTRGIVASNQYEIALASAQSDAKIRLILESVESPTTRLPPDEEILGEADVEFPTGNLVVSEIASGAQGPVTMPAGPGIYHVTISGNRQVRQQVAQATQKVFGATRDLDRIRELLQELDGAEWYRLRFHRTGDSPEIEEDE